MEVIYEHLARKAPEKAREFEHSLNSYFVEEGIGWHLVKGKVLARGSEVFESSVQKAVSALEDSGRVTAKNEMHEALKDLSRRPTPDLTGAIHHAMASLECVAREVCGNPKATLGDILKRYAGIIPKPLDDAVEKAWGYASERGRHIREGREPERKEVELIVGIAATVATYVAR